MDKSEPRLSEWGVATATQSSVLGVSRSHSSASSVASHDLLGKTPTGRSPVLPVRQRLSPHSWQSVSPRSVSPRSPTGPPLVDSLFPALGNALAALEAERPDNPLEWLGLKLIGRSSPLPPRTASSALQSMNLFDFFDHALAPVLGEAMLATRRSGAVGSAAVQELGHNLLAMSR